MADWKDVVAQPPGGALLRHRAMLAGQVVDALSKAPIAGAVLTLDAGPPAFRALRDALTALQAANPHWQPRGIPFDRRISRADGRFVFTDLPSGGAYDLHVAAPHLGSRYEHDWKRTVTPPNTQLSVALQPTCISGTVRDPEGEPLPGARIALVGASDTAYTNDAGTFTLAPIAAGPWTVVISRTGYCDPQASLRQPVLEVRRKVVVAQGKQRRLTIALRPQ